MTLKFHELPPDQSENHSHERTLRYRLERKLKRAEEALLRPEPIYVFLQMSRCPECEAVDAHRSYRTDRNGDGTKTNWVYCKACGIEYRLVWE